MQIRFAFLPLGFRRSNNKVSDTLHTRLSLSMANLSRLFCLPRKFLTLYRLVVAPVISTENWIKLQGSALVNYLSQPLTHIRLPAYLLARNWQTKMDKVWAVPRSLATTNGIVVYFLFLWVLRCFSSPAYRYLTYEFS